MYTLLSKSPTENCLSSTPSATLRAPLATTIFVVRHAEVHNPGDILYGRLPRFRLSSRGWEQAEHTAKFLSSRELSAIYTSPLLRARQTASVLSHYHPGSPVHHTQDLLEVRTAYQGEPNSILKPGFSFYEPKRDPADETMDDVWRRMERFLRRVIRRHPGEAVAAVSHADPITILRVGLLGKPMTSSALHSVVYAERASVTEVVVGPEGQPTLSYFNSG
jgi:broad specificity phosphatase PhoE